MVARHNAPKAAPRGPAARRAGGRADKDGDIAMGVSIKGRGGISKTTPTGPKAESTVKGASVKRGILGPNAQRDILRGAGARDVSMRQPRTSGARGGLVDLKVTGWEKSKASENADQGISALIQWLEKKASTKLGTKRRVKIRKSSVEGSELIIKVASEDVGAIVRMNNYGWAGINISIARLDGAEQEPAAPSAAAEKTKAMLRGVIERRYVLDSKFLNLTELGQDEELRSEQIFDQKSTASKFFPAMMKVLNSVFDRTDDRDAAIISVSLANNELEDLTTVSTLSMTLPKLRNLDLSNNKFANLDKLVIWRKRFYHLEHLIVTGNPLEQNEPNYAQTLISWYPNLRQLNGIQVRTEEEVASKSKITNLPFPIRGPLFLDEGGIAESFIRKFFPAFDADRQAVAIHYFDEKSQFSYAVNTHAPTDPARSQKIEKGEWELYVKNSRNLKKISHLPARQNRIFRGTKAIGNAFAMLPATKHPDLTTEARSWMIEAKMVPCVPDATGASPNGVDGFLITVSGEFEEVNGGKKRSFDRIIVLGPGAGPDGVRVVHDVLTIRGYGGNQAFQPENFEGWIDASQLQQPTTGVEAAAPGLPAGLSLELAEQMVSQLSQKTNMTLAYAKDCLDQTNWSGDAALAAFESVKGNLPAEAFIQPTA